MAVNEKLVAKAAELLIKGKFTTRTSVAEAVERLFDYSPFSDMDEEDVEPIAAAAIGLLPASAPTTPDRRGNSSGHNQGGRPSASGGPTRQAPRRREVSSFKPSAPFRFIDLPDDVVPADEAVSQSKPLPGGLCATLDVEWVVETPLLIGGEKDDRGAVCPMTLAGPKDWVIPGASLRGLIRSAVEIVALARIGTVDRHLRFGLRDFEHPAYADRSAVSKLPEVKAGWLTWSPSTDPKGEPTWLVTSIGTDWAHIEIETLGQGPTKLWSDRQLTSKYEAFGMKQAGDKLVDFARSRDFTAPAPDRQSRKVSKLGPGRRGILVFSGKLPGGGNKRFEYVFFDQATATAKPVPLDDDIVALFERLSCKPAKNRLEPDGSWRDLRPTLAKGGRIPIFYVGDLARQKEPGFFFGLTRLFKIPHERTIGDVIAEQSAHALPTLEAATAGKRDTWRYPADFVENLFGYVVEPKDVRMPDGERAPPDAIARKGRIAFEFARPTPTSAAVLSDPIDVILSAPRASYAPFYLRSPGEKDYSAVTAPKIAGRKRYLPRYPTGTPTRKVLDDIRAMGAEQIRAAGLLGGKRNDKVISALRFLCPAPGKELRFSGRIRLHNVTEAELGAVLFALTHGGDPKKPGRHMIGRARAFGAGQVRVAQARLDVAYNDVAIAAPAPETEEIVDAQGMIGFCPAPAPTRRSHGHRPFIDAFMAAMETATGQPHEERAAIQEFLGAARPAAAPPPDLVYMELKRFAELRNAVKPLKGARENLPGAPPQVLDPSPPRDGRMLPAPRVRFWR